MSQNRYGQPRSNARLDNYRPTLVRIVEQHVLDKEPHLVADSDKFRARVRGLVHDYLNLRSMPVTQVMEGDQ